MIHISIIYSESVNSCTDPTFFSYDSGNGCCETNSCGPSCCTGTSAQCKNSDGSVGSDCIDGGSVIDNLIRSKI